MFGYLREQNLQAERQYEISFYFEEYRRRTYSSHVFPNFCPYVLDCSESSIRFRHLNYESAEGNYSKYGPLRTIIYLEIIKRGPLLSIYLFTPSMKKILCNLMPIKFMKARFIVRWNYSNLRYNLWAKGQSFILLTTCD